MHIKIALKLRPFSHAPGARCLIPYTTWEVQAFPALLIFKDLVSGKKKEVHLSLKGPVKGFTLILDLERGRVELIRRGEKKLLITQEHYPFLKETPLEPSSMRLSLGIHKKQDWDLVQRRCQMEEVFPFLVRLSHLIPEVLLPSSETGMMQLVETVADGRLFQAGFQGILSPRLNDENHLGILEEKEVKGCPIGLIHAAARQICRLFFIEENEAWEILPSLPKEFHAGRIVSLATEKGHRIHLEWSKKQIKKISIYPACDEEVLFVFKKGVKSYRVRKNGRAKGDKVEAKETLQLKSGQPLYLDRFST